MPLHRETGIYFETHGSGAAIFLGPPLVATTAAAEPQIQHLKQALIDELSPNYRLLFIDYPYGRGQSIVPAESSMCAESVTQDLIRVAEAAGSIRFTWFGYSWGAVLGFQLALRTNRLSGLISGGFPPRGGPYSVMRETCRRLTAQPPSGHSAEFMAQYWRYYESLHDFNDREVISKIKIPRLIFAGTRDVVDYGGGKADIGATIQANRELLECLGWQVHLIPDADHSAAVEAEVVVPLMRAFLDEVENREDDSRC